MSALTPTFALAAGDLRARTGEPVGGPTRMAVDRDMDLACDTARVDLAERGGVEPGDRLELALGHDGDEATVFVGEVAAVCPTLDGVVLHGLGVMRALLELRVATAYRRRTAGSIVLDLLDRAGLTPGTVEDGPPLPRYVVHPARGAYGHLRELADRLGLELYADRMGRVMFHAPATTAAPGGSTRYTFGRDLLAARGQRHPAVRGGVRIGGESPMSQRGADTSHWLTREERTSPDPAGVPDGPQRVLLDPVARTEDLADRFAEGWWAVATRAVERLRLRVLGRPEVDLGDPAAATGSPDEALDGSGYVRALRHVLDAERGFVTEVTVATGGRR